ncbi:MAG: aspartate dehydrogenase [Alphaproteobacteria bacterium]|nr:aspartate dehydrogenase [Alphaproteobacteria bacterium]
MVRLGLLGFGAIGRRIAEACAAGQLDGIDLTAALVRRPRPGASGRPDITHDPDWFLRYRFDVVVEGAGHQAVRDYAERILESGTDLYVTSVGAFTDTALLERVVAAARGSGSRVYLPSAGIGGLDMLASLAEGGLDEATITVRKDPASWKGTAAEELVDLDGLTQPHTVFDGPVREGARLYPQNVNISAATAFAGIGLDRTRVVIVADPTITTHVCEIAASGPLGAMRFVEDLVPSPENRKTSTLVGHAIVKTLRNRVATLVIGG